MFAGIARGVVKHHKKIVVAWLVLLLASLYPLQFVSDAVVYEEAGFAPGNVESMKAQDIIDEQFPTSMANSTVLVVVESPDIASEEVRDFAIELESSVRGSSDIKDLEGFTSVYSVYEFAIMEAARSLAPELSGAEVGLDDAAFKLFSGPSYYSEAWDGITVDNDAFNDSWDEYNTKYNTTITDQNLSGLLYDYSVVFWHNWTESLDINSSLRSTEERGR
jgi:predicted RND superfamily exporter protein